MNHFPRLLTFLGAPSVCTAASHTPDPAVHPAEDQAALQEASEERGKGCCHVDLSPGSCFSAKALQDKYIHTLELLQLLAHAAS